MIHRPHLQENPLHLGEIRNADCLGLTLDLTESESAFKQDPPRGAAGRGVTCTFKFEVHSSGIFFQKGT